MKRYEQGFKGMRLDDDGPWCSFDDVERENERLQKERDRLLVLAIKFCPKDHHDWQELENYLLNDEFSTTD